MKEKAYDTISHGTCFRVWPFLAADAPDERETLASYVEAVRVYSRGGPREWRVVLQLSSDPTYGHLSREQSDQLAAALGRCWEWVALQEETGG